MFAGSFDFMNCSAEELRRHGEWAEATAIDNSSGQKFAAKTGGAGLTDQQGLDLAVAAAAVANSSSMGTAVTTFGAGLLEQQGLDLATTAVANSSSMGTAATTAESVGVVTHQQGFGLAATTVAKNLKMTPTKGTKETEAPVLVQEPREDPTALPPVDESVNAKFPLSHLTSPPFAFAPPIAGTSGHLANNPIDAHGPTTRGNALVRESDKGADTSVVETTNTVERDWRTFPTKPAEPLWDWKKHENQKRRAPRKEEKEAAALLLEKSISLSFIGNSQKSLTAAGGCGWESNPGSGFAAAADTCDDHKMAASDFTKESEVEKANGIQMKAGPSFATTALVRDKAADEVEQSSRDSHLLAALGRSLQTGGSGGVMSQPGPGMAAALAGSIRHMTFGTTETTAKTAGSIKSIVKPTPDTSGKTRIGVPPLVETINADEDDGEDLDAFDEVIESEEEEEEFQVKTMEPHGRHFGGDNAPQNIYECGAITAATARGMKEVLAQGVQLFKGIRLHKHKVGDWNGMKDCLLLGDEDEDKKIVVTDENHVRVVALVYGSFLWFVDNKSDISKPFNGKPAFAHELQIKTTLSGNRYLQYSNFWDRRSDTQKEAYILAMKSRNNRRANRNAASDGHDAMVSAAHYGPGTFGQPIAQRYGRHGEWSAPYGMNLPSRYGSHPVHSINVGQQTVDNSRIINNDKSTHHHYHPPPSPAINVQDIVKATVAEFAAPLYGRVDTLQGGVDRLEDGVDRVERATTRKAARSSMNNDNGTGTPFGWSRTSPAVGKSNVSNADHDEQQPKVPTETPARRLFDKSPPTHGQIENSVPSGMQPRSGGGASGNSRQAPRNQGRTRAQATVTLAEGMQATGSTMGGGLAYDSTDEFETIVLKKLQGITIDVIKGVLVMTYKMNQEDLDEKLNGQRSKKKYLVKLLTPFMHEIGMTDAKLINEMPPKVFIKSLSKVVVIPTTDSSE